MSLARRHREFVLAQQASSAVVEPAAAAAAAPPMPTDGPAASEYQQLLIALGEDLRQLQNIQSVEAKIERKRALIGRYRAWVHGAISAPTGAQDEIVANILVWAIDVADWDFALTIAQHVLAHGLAMPERYSRKPAVIIAEEVAEAGLRKPPIVDYETMRAVAELTAAHDMHDQVRAKLEKAMGLALQARAEAFDTEAESAVAGGKGAVQAAALRHFQRALELDKNSGVKKLIERLGTQLNKAATEPATTESQT